MANCDDISGLLCWVQGDTKVINVEFTDHQGVRVPTVGWSSVCQIRKVFIANSPPQPALTTLPGVWVSGAVTHTLVSDESWKLMPGKYLLDVKVDDGSTSIRTVYRTNIEIKGAVSKEATP